MRPPKIRFRRRNIGRGYTRAESFPKPVNGTFQSIAPIRQVRLPGMVFS